MTMNVGAAVPTIRVSSAATEGVTALTAFDRALAAMGVGDLNLVVLSSVIPVGAAVVRATPRRCEFAPGDRLYCVLAEQRCTDPGSEAWAGLGWVADRWGRGGAFLEAHGGSECVVRHELEVGLEQMVDDRPYWEFDRPDFEIAGATCDAAPVCAAVLAVYRAEPW